MIILGVVAVAYAAPQGYNLPTPSGSSLSLGSCSEGQVLHLDGRCVTPQVNRRVFLYDIPRNTEAAGPPPIIPEPTVETNILIIRTPEEVVQDPIVVPPPRQEHVVYILKKQSGKDARVIEVPSAPQTAPKVYFVNYAEEENPFLPSGVDLRTALSAAEEIGSDNDSVNQDFGVVSEFGSNLEPFGNLEVSEDLGNTNSFEFSYDSNTEANTDFGGHGNSNLGNIINLSTISTDVDTSNGFETNNGNFEGISILSNTNGFGINDNFEISGAFQSNADFGLGDIQQDSTFSIL